MSAFMVGHDHIDGLLTLASRASSLIWRTDSEALEHRAGYGRIQRTARTPDYLTLIGRMLLAENSESVGFRYQEDRDPSVLLYEFREVYEPLSTVAGLSMLGCYEYQACEHDGWANSEAKRFCDALRGYLITQLAGYENAPWEFVRREVAA